MSGQGLDDPLRMIRVSAAAKVVEKITGERPHVATLHRWASRGLKGVRLRTAYAGGHRRTTEKWIREFFEAVTASANGGRKPKRLDQDAASRANDELAAAGY
ncbi:hypothetical protein Enr13x_56590 [Stieleria neptunia]|uniref:Uncharacterized protein n=2 Tax=Stieleria neptunia TaxID=2527979 RepID=A0A518HY36_9BACT|nr:hypothetical protein Enr13x_56590 [Stieleria neptunia]